MEVGKECETGDGRIVLTVGVMMNFWKQMQSQANELGNRKSCPPNSRWADGQSSSSRDR